MGENTLKNICVLCNGINTDFFNIHQTYPNLEESPVLFRTDNFIVMPDKYPLREGHLLIIPKEHTNSLAEFSSKASSEVGFIYDRIQQATKADSFLIFEHGTSKLEQVITDPKIKSIFHAHLQFIPNLPCAHQDLEGFFEKKNVKLLDEFGKPKYLEEYKGIYVGSNQIINFLRQNITYDDRSINSIRSYLYIKTSDNNQFFFPEFLMTPKLPSQFLREALSEASNTPEWNWKIPMTSEALTKYFNRINKTIELFK